MIIDDYYKDLRKNILIDLFAFVILISAAIYFQDAKVIFASVSLFYIVVVYNHFEHVPGLNSKISIDIDNDVIKLINYPVLIPDERDSRGYTWRNKSVDIPINKMRNIRTKGKKIIFMYDYEEFVLPINNVTSTILELAEIQ